MAEVAEVAVVENCAGVVGVSSNSVQREGCREVMVEGGYEGMLAGSGASD